MDTKAWGPPLWDSLFFIAYGYGTNTSTDPNKDEQYIQFFQSLTNVLPCKYCRESLAGFIEQANPREYLRDGRGLVRFVYDLKNLVNQKLMKQEFDAATEKFNSLMENRSRMSPHDFNVQLRDLSRVFYTRDPPPFEQVVAKYAKHEAGCSIKMKTCRSAEQTVPITTDTSIYAAMKGGLRQYRISRRQKSKAKKVSKPKRKSMPKRRSTKRRSTKRSKLRRSVRNVR